MEVYIYIYIYACLIYCLSTLICGTLQINDFEIHHHNLKVLVLQRWYWNCRLTSVNARMCVWTLLLVILTLWTFNIWMRQTHLAWALKLFICGVQMLSCAMLKSNWCIWNLIGWYVYFKLSTSNCATLYVVIWKLCVVAISILSFEIWRLQVWVSATDLWSLALWCRGFDSELCNVSVCDLEY